MSGADSSIGELAVRLVGSLAVVVGLMLLIARTVNRRFKAPSGAAIQVVHRQALGRGMGVAVVSVGTRVLVIGTTEQQVTLLAEMEPDEIGLDLATEEPADPAPARHRRIGPVSEESPTRTLVTTAPTGPLAGSVLSPQTWKQTLAAFTGGAAEPAPPRRRAS
ncbi:FliO/MopB family protein [Nocardioides sp. CPCC 206347]|uniref:FliO/MopB family protein n=1 Tax=Nocardioides sp. CPCC 206347 TaxID=3406463 RepID=UPI003B433415